MIYDTNAITAVRKANVRLVPDNRITDVRFLRAAHVANSDPSLNEIVRDSYNSYFKCPFGMCFYFEIKAILKICKVQEIHVVKETVRQETLNHLRRMCGHLMIRM